ncbi:MAG TPA: PDZ domain-containing protein [Candidatus Acidoferrales bacterium]|nr:PDZ domain-containing protein [Candidatus Acidoferrales bacterium]
MRTHLWTIIPLLPLLAGVSFAAQNYSVDSPGQPWVFSSEDGGTGSYLGVDIADVTAERLGALKLKEEKGVEVTMVDQDAPAGKAGIKEHDVILTMNGTAIESGAQLRRMIHETPPGRVITLGLSRAGQPMSVKLELADKHKEFAFTGPNPDIHVNIPDIHIPDIDIPSMNMVVVTSSARSGLMVENITPQLGEFFGVKNGNGVLVRSVEKGSRAERAGFHAGDVIVKVNDQAIHDTSDFSHAVRSRNGNSVNVAVMRDKKEQNLTLSLPAHKDSSDLYEEESFSGQPWAEAQSAFELSKANVQDEIAKLRPELEAAAENSRKQAEQIREELRREEKEFRQETEEQREQMQKNMRQFRRELMRMRADWL